MEWFKTEIQIPSRRDPWFLRPISDAHLGSAACDMAAVKEEINVIKNTPNCFTFLGGDICEAIWVDDSKRFDLDMHVLDPSLHRDYAKKSAARAAELFHPIKDKILFVLTGNHEEEFHRRHHFDISAEIADRLKTPYLMYSALVLIKVLAESRENDKRTEYHVRLRAHHGSGGGRKHGGKINRVVDMAISHDADIYWMGHVHTPIKTITTRMGITDTGKPVKRDMAFLVNGSFLKTFIPGQAGYAERLDLPSSYMGVMPLKIWHTPDRGNTLRME